MPKDFVFTYEDFNKQVKNKNVIIKASKTLSI